MTSSAHGPFAAHRALPWPLRAEVVAPAILTLVIAGGTLFTLPPGPLCDEGMVLFMEGGCDWGDSNIFFFSKLGLLVGMNLVWLIAYLNRVRTPSAFVPHLLTLAGLAALFHSGGGCDTYYDHPNGSIGQMVIEIMACAMLGLSLLKRVGDRGPLVAAATLTAWNVTYVAVFYAGLLFTDHWTWLHTIWIVGALAGLSMIDGPRGTFEEPERARGPLPVAR